MLRLCLRDNNQWELCVLPPLLPQKSSEGEPLPHGGASKKGTERAQRGGAPLRASVS